VFKISATDRAFQQLQALTDQGMTTPEAVKKMIAADPSLASEIEVEEVTDSRKTIMFDAPKHTPAASGGLSTADVRALLGEVYSKGRSDVEQDMRLTQLETRSDTHEILFRGLAGSHISHLGQHAALDAGEIDRLDPAASLRPFLEALPKDQYDAALAGLPTSFRELLEPKAALPALKPVSDDRTLEAEVKPKRGWFGAS
jgi:hypothetical protein